MHSLENDEFLVWNVAFADRDVYPDGAGGLLIDSDTPFPDYLVREFAERGPELVDWMEATQAYKLWHEDSEEDWDDADE